MRRFIVLAIVCAAPAALLAQVAAPTLAETSAAPAVKAEKEKKICRREETTGSIMATRVCHSKEEWVQIDAANAKAVDQFNTSRRNGHGMEGSGG